MRSVKTKGGLTRGRGLTETQGLVWLLSMHACAGVNCALQDLTAVTYNTSDQHKEATRARQERDFKYTEELLKCLQSRNPFTDEQSTAHQIKTSNIRALTETLGPAVCSHMLLLYALLGCDTTPRIYGIGKATTLKKAMINEHFRKQAQVF